MVTTFPMPPTISNPRSFYEEGRHQRECAVCESTGPFEVHHVISKQRLKRMHREDVLYDPRNALRLCEGLDTNQCHHKLKIKTEDLTPDNICFIWEILKLAGYNYLERHYSGAESRFTMHEHGRCPLCQLQPLAR